MKAKNISMKNDDDKDSENRAGAYVRNAVGQPKCSTGEQVAAIHEFAQRRGLEIVKMYAHDTKAD